MLSPSHAYAQGGNVRCRVCYYRCSPEEQVIIQSRLALGNTGLREGSSYRASSCLYTPSIPALQLKIPS